MANLFEELKYVAKIENLNLRKNIIEEEIVE